MLNDNVRILKQTMDILKHGYYHVGDERKELKLSRSEMEEARVFLPDEIKALENHKFEKHVYVMGRCGYECENIDSFSLARKMADQITFMKENRKPEEILVLNFANPVNPGGGARRGESAQEEDLCRKSSLLLSLESKAARKYYKYNKYRSHYGGSDAIIITPKVEIIRDENNELLDESVIVSVMTCAAPRIIYKEKKRLTETEYTDMFYKRIVGMLRCAAYLGYRRLVLGAFGCGAFGNDAKMVSDLFYKALKEFNFDGMREKDCFNRINFAVLSESDEQYNFKQFYRNFGGDNFYRDENEAEVRYVLKQKKDREVYLDKIRGSLIGGAAGDALGYSVEFLQDYQIFQKYGSSGITEYSLVNGIAQISDDTQMTLFTANGILCGATRVAMRGIGGDPEAYVRVSYLDWLLTQELTYEEGKKVNGINNFTCNSWLLDVPELYSTRAPGNTCISALRTRRNGYSRNFTGNPINQSKGCGGIMRIAPLGLHYEPYSDKWLDELQKSAAEISAITHGHPLGYIPSAVLTQIINQCVYPFEEKTLKQIVIDAKNRAMDIFRDKQHIEEMSTLIDKAIELSENDIEDLENIKSLGEGWVAEETLAIAIYCSLKYENDFSKGIIAAVNHSGDSDSTGAVVGNILGARLGYSKIEQKWIDHLELREVIDEMAHDLCYGCLMSEYSYYKDEDWVRKYIYNHWKEIPSMSK